MRNDIWNFSNIFLLVMALNIVYLNINQEFVCIDLEPSMNRAAG